MGSVKALFLPGLDASHPLGHPSRSISQCRRDYRVLDIAIKVQTPTTAVGNQPTSAGLRLKSCPPFSTVRVMRKNTTPKSAPKTVRVPAPVVRNGPKTKGSASKVTTITAKSLAMRDQ